MQISVGEHKLWCLLCLKGGMVHIKPLYVSQGFRFVAFLECTRPLELFPVQQISHHVVCRRPNLRCLNEFALHWFSPTYVIACALPSKSRIAPPIIQTIKLKRFGVAGGQTQAISGCRPSSGFSLTVCNPTSIQFCRSPGFHHGISMVFAT